MEIITQVNVVLMYNQQQDCRAYIEEIPEIKATGKTLAEAKENLISDLERYERETYSNYSIAEYKFKSASFV
jgi:predicted RNase H-like HicB family nuclease